MKCPCCFSDGAYVSLTQVECLNVSCHFFSEELLSEEVERGEKAFHAVIEDLGFGDELREVLKEMW